MWSSIQQLIQRYFTVGSRDLKKPVELPVPSVGARAELI